MSDVSTPASVERRLAALHGAGQATLTHGSSSAAAAALLGLTNQGGHVIASRYVHGLTGDFLRYELPQLGREVTLVDCTDPGQVSAGMRANTQVVFVESLGDPVPRPAPINDLATFAQSHDLLLVVDNTGLSPALLRPLDLGAHVVVEDCGPHLDGFGDVSAGMVAGSHRLMRQVRAQALRSGASLDPWTARLFDRSLVTLRLRTLAQQHNADLLAAALRAHPAVTVVHRPSFDDHPWALETHEGFGNLLAFEADVPPAALTEVVDAVNAGSEPGGLTTVAAVPAATTHAGMGEREREAMGVTEGLVRVAAGLEDPQPLVRRLTRTLDRLHARDGLVGATRTGR